MKVKGAGRISLYSGAIIWTGEGEQGTYARHTGRPTLLAINRRVARERCGGDRWAIALIPMAGPAWATDTYATIDAAGECQELQTVHPQDIS